MTYTCFDVSITDKVAHIVLSNPDKRNAMSKDFWYDLPAVIQDIDNNAKARAIVISSTGPVFSSGIDVAMLTDVTGSPEKNRAKYGAEFLLNVKQMQDTFTILEDSRIPVIAAIQGGCLGGGVDLVTACDIRVGTEDSYITIHEINVGMTADVGTFPRIVNHLPEGLVREIAYTGRKMHADELLKHGFYNRTYATHQEMVEDALRLARDIASKAPLAVYGSKKIITHARNNTTKDTLDYIAVWNMSMLSQEEIIEAIQSSREKRPGNFLDLPVKKH